MVHFGNEVPLYNATAFISWWLYILMQDTSSLFNNYEERKAVTQVEYP